MIVLPRADARRFRAVARRGLPPGRPRGPAPRVRLAADGGRLTLTAHLGEVVVALVPPQDGQADSGVVTAVCRNCGNRAAQVITRRSTKFTLFFIPLFPVRTRYVQQCSFCGAEYGIAKDEARSLPVG